MGPLVLPTLSSSARRTPADDATQWNFEGITETARRKGKVGLVVWKPKHAKDEDVIVLMRWRDFVVR